MTATSSPPLAAGPDAHLLNLSLAPQGLYAVYQPIVRLEDFQVVAHEGLMRVSGSETSPLVVLDAARRQGRLGDLETAAARVVVSQYDYASPDEHLLINVSTHAILQDAIRPQALIDTLSEAGVDLGRFVIELTERDIVENISRLGEAIGFLRTKGVRLALDDFGMGHSNFELWLELAPEFVKLDRYLIDGIARSNARLAIVKALVQVAGELGTDLIAEGIEEWSDLDVVKDLGVRFGQGYLLGRPQIRPQRELPERVLRGETNRSISYSRSNLEVDSRITAVNSLVETPLLTEAATNQDADKPRRNKAIRPSKLAVDDGNLQLALTNRKVFNDRASMPPARDDPGL